MGAARRGFLDRHPLQGFRLSDPEGKFTGITNRIRGGGPPLVLMPLSLAPSQWDPLIATLSARYCTISLRRAASRRRRDPRRARPPELPGDGEKPAGAGGNTP